MPASTHAKTRLEDHSPVQAAFVDTISMHGPGIVTLLVCVLIDFQPKSKQARDQPSSYYPLADLLHAHVMFVPCHGVLTIAL